MQLGFEYIQRLRLHAPSGQPVPVFNHPHSQNRIKHFLFMFKQNFLHFNLCSLPLVLSWVLQRTVWLRLLYSHIRHLRILIRSPRASSRLNSPSPLSLSSFIRCSRPLTIITALHWAHLSMSMCFLYWGAQDWTQQSSCVSPLLSRGIRSLDLLLVMLSDAIKDAHLWSLCPLF